MEETDAKQNGLIVLPNGVVIPTKAFILAVHDAIIGYRKEIGRDDPKSFRNEGLLDYLYDSLTDRLHKYKTNSLENALYVATETFYCIACQHVFTEANKSTAYVSALVILSINNTFNASPVPYKHSVIRNIVLNFDSGKWFIDTPDEVKEIVKLAEGGDDEIKLKRLIKEFLQKQIGVKNE